MPKLEPNGRGAITQSMIDRIPLQDSGQTVWWLPATVLSGFGVLVGVRGKSYIVQGRVMVSGKMRERRINIGKATTMTLEDALERGRELQKQMADGVDPKAAARAAAAAEAAQWTLARMLERVRQKKGQNHARDAEMRLTDWLDIPAKDITGQMVTERYHAIREGIAAKGRSSGVSMANKVFREFKAVWRFIDTLDLELGRCPADALRHESLPTPVKDDRIPADGLAGFWRDIWREPFDPGRDAVILMLLTGLRRNVACSLRVDEWDSAARVIRLAGERMKNRKPHNIPVSSEVAAMLDRRLETARHGYLFPGKTAGRGKTKSEPYVKEPRAVLDRVGKRGGWHCSVHGLRRTFNSECIGLFDSAFRRRLMAHAPVSGDVNDTNYSVIDVEAMRPAAQAATDKLLSYADSPEDVRRRMASGQGVVHNWRHRADDQLHRNLEASVLAATEAVTNDPELERQLFGSVAKH